MGMNRIFITTRHSCQKKKNKQIPQRSVMEEKAVKNLSTCIIQQINTTTLKIHLHIRSELLARKANMCCIYLRNNSWKPYVYIAFTTGRPLCHEGLPRAQARGKKLT